MKTKSILNGAVRGIVTTILLIIAMKWGEAHPSAGAPPKAGDIFATYHDRRNDSFALTNGFAPQSITITKIVKVENGVAYAALFNMDITQLKGFVENYNEWGPVSNYRTYKQYYTPVPPTR